MADISSILLYMGWLSSTIREIVNANKIVQKDNKLELKVILVWYLDWMWAG